MAPLPSNMSGFDPARRARNLERLANETFDVLVIGGGITGAGVAREAALRGLSVALVEARDFASGTSSRSSKLIHGGLRYLEQGEIALVREAATERKTLRRIAPHRTAVAPMFLPVHGRTSAGLYKLRVGLALYEKLAAVPADRASPRARNEARRSTAEPHLTPDRLQGAIRLSRVPDRRRAAGARHAQVRTSRRGRRRQLRRASPALGNTGSPRVVAVADDEGRRELRRSCSHGRERERALGGRSPPPGSSRGSRRVCTSPRASTSSSERAICRHGIAW